MHTVDCATSYNHDTSEPVEYRSMSVTLTFFSLAVRRSHLLYSTLYKLSPAKLPRSSSMRLDMTFPGLFINAGKEVKDCAQDLPSSK